MPTIIDCANLALTHLGEALIASLDDENARARTLKVLVDPTRQGELRRNVWTFASRRDSIAESLPVPAFGFGHGYTLPVGCLRVLQVGELDVPLSMWEARGAPYQYFRVEGRRILCDDSAPLPIRYVVDETDVSVWDSLFFDYMAWCLAFRACMAITKDSELRDRLRVDAKEAFDEAVRTGSIELPPTETPDDSWIISRF